MKPRQEFGTLIGLATEILRREDAEMRRCEESELRCDRLARQPIRQAQVGNHKGHNFEALPILRRQLVKIN